VGLTARLGLVAIGLLILCSLGFVIWSIRDLVQHIKNERKDDR